VEWSSADLERAKRDVVARRSDLRRAGVELLSAGFDIIANRVSVGVRGPLEEARQVLTDLRPMIRVEHEDRGQAD
jgi:hypothetical protein